MRGRDERLLCCAMFWCMCVNVSAGGVVEWLVVMSVVVAGEGEDKGKGMRRVDSRPKQALGERDRGRGREKERGRGAV